MEEHIVKILSIESVTHNVRQYNIEKPNGYHFIPGQATEVAINLPEWKNERRPFTFTSLNDWDHLQFTIKSYSDHNGVTNQLGQLKAGDELILHDVWGAIQYKGEGTFIAGGAGVTPFIAIFRQLHHVYDLQKRIIAQDSGGYIQEPAWINTVQRTQVSHLPVPYDARAIDRGIGVYFTELHYGGVSFAILEDRKWKSAPKSVLPDRRRHPSWTRSPGRRRS